VRWSTAALAGLLAVVATAPRRAQGQSSRAEQKAAWLAKRITHAGVGLSDAQAGALLAEMRQITEQALAASRAAEHASDVAGVKAAASQVVQAVWGIPSGVEGDTAEEIQVPGWKERWQVTGAEFDTTYSNRLGTKPPAITDPHQLGIAGRGRAVRTHLQDIIDGKQASEAQKEAARAAFASLNDVIGWMHMTVGFKGREVQPRVSLTQEWDAPDAFWQSDADSGWLYAAYAQATNILKTDYQGDVAMARQHAAAMSSLLQRVLDGTDADGDGTVEPKMMEGGLRSALAEAARAGLPDH
jgi:hypothetical protein